MAFVEGPRHAVITPDNVGPVIHIVAWFLAVLMVMATTLRLLIRFTTIHVPGFDDVLVSIATLLGIGEVIAISFAVRDGLGTAESLLTAAQLGQIEKEVYAANLLYLLTIACAKASAICLLHRLANHTRHEWVVRSLAVLTLLWTITATFGLAFQCSIPDPWGADMAKCIDIMAFWDAIGAVDIVLDACLVATPAWIVWDLRIDRSRKLIAVSGFTFRLALCATQLVRLIFLSRALHKGALIYETLGYTLATQCQTMLAVTAACIPALKPFMDRAASGLMGISFQQRGGVYDVTNNGTYEMSGHARDKENNSGQSRRAKGNFLSDRSNNHSHVSANRAGGSPGAKSGPQHTVQENGMIQKTVDWDVEYSDEVHLNKRLASLENSSDGEFAHVASAQPSDGSNHHDM